MKTPILTQLLMIAPLSCSCLESPHDEGRALHMYLMAYYKTAEGSFQDASRYYEQLMEKSDIPKAIYKGYIQFLALTNQYTQILDLKEKLDSFFPHDAAIQTAIIDALEHADAQKQATERLIQLSQHNKTSAEISFRMAQTYMARQEPKNAIRVIDEFLDNTGQRPNTFMFHFLKAQISVQLDEKTTALEEIKKSVKLQPHFDKGWLLCAILEEQYGHIQEAIQAFSKYLELVGHDTTISQHLAQLSLKQNNLAKKNEPADNSALDIQQIITLIEQKKSKHALGALEHYLKTHPKNQKARLLKLETLASLNKIGVAVSHLVDWLLEDPNNELWYKALLLLTHRGLLYSDAIHTLHIVEKKYPNLLINTFYLADLYLRSGQAMVALPYLKNITHSNCNSLIKCKTYYQMACIYYDQHDYKHMLESIEHGTASHNDFAPLCNLCAYYYAGKGHDIQKAFSYSNRALAHDPANPHYLDTKGYILYKAQEYTQANPIYEKILKELPDDPWIKKHATKVKNKIADKKHFAFSLFENVLYKPI